MGVGSTGNMSVFLVGSYVPGLKLLLDCATKKRFLFPVLPIATPLVNPEPSCEGTAMSSGIITSPVHFPDVEKKVTSSSQGRFASLLGIS